VQELRGRELERRFEEVLDRLGAFFMGDSPVHQAAEQIARLLAEAGIDYTIAGALALGAHGFVRATEDVDVLVTREGLARFKGEWLGRGYVNVRPGGKAVRDAAHGVRIDFLIAGDYPGDGLPKPVAFPEPALAGVDAGKYRILRLPRLVELKLASGMTAPHRLQDLADVMRLIRSASLPRELAQELDPYVRAKFDELWLLAQHPDDDT
jgi:hypothetical protein